MKGLYVHVPFCVRKCHYCDFYSVAGRTELLDRYVEALLLEAAKYEGMRFETVYIGGGTPSVLGPARLRRMFEGLSMRLDIAGSVETTMEANPDSATTDFLSSALSAGVNRLSIGVQSLNDDELRKAGRIHTSEQASQAISAAMALGFDDVSADVIIGLPGQTRQSLLDTFSRLVSMGLSHLSSYCLSIENDTLFATNPPAGLVDDDGQADLYEAAEEFLVERGFCHYEISNYSLPGRASAHNLNYWRGGDYVGLGPSAASHIGGKRIRNSADVDAYLFDPLALESDEESLDIEAKVGEEAMLRLRLLDEGVDLVHLETRHGKAGVGPLRERLDLLTHRGQLSRSGTKYRIPQGKALTSNQILMEVVA